MEYYPDQWNGTPPAVLPPSQTASEDPYHRCASRQVEVALTFPARGHQSTFAALTSPLLTSLEKPVQDVT